MPEVFALAVGIGCWNLYRRRNGSRLAEFLAPLAAFRPSLRLTRIALALLVVAFAAQLAALSLQPRLDPTVVPWAASLPIPVVLEDPPLHVLVHAGFMYLAFVLALVETGCLAVVALGAAFFEGRAGRLQLACAAAGMAAAALAAPFLSTRDCYEYVQVGWLGFRAYAPAGVVLPPLYAPVAEHTAVGGLIYGPLWLLINGAVTALGSTIVAKIVALRIFNVVLLAATLAVLAWAGVARRSLIVFALNPALLLYFVTDVHIDVQGIGLLIVAYGFMRKKLPALACLFIVLAGLIKISFLVIGGVILCSVRPLWRRAALWAFVVACGIVVSYALGGDAYFHGLLGYSAQKAVRVPFLVQAFALCSFTLVLTFTALGTLFGRWFDGAPWLFPALSPIAFPWYLLSGLPYALASGRYLTTFLVMMPLAAAAIDGVDNALTAACIVASLLTAALAADVTHTVRRELPKRAAPTG